MLTRSMKSFPVICTEIKTKNKKQISYNSLHVTFILFIKRTYLIQATELLLNI